jgi:hypothetical protein
MLSMYSRRLEMSRLCESVEEKRGQKQENSSSLFVSPVHDIWPSIFKPNLHFTDLLQMTKNGYRVKSLP